MTHIMSYSTELQVKSWYNSLTVVNWSSGRRDQSPFGFLLLQACHTRNGHTHHHRVPKSYSECPLHNLGKYVRCATNTNKTPILKQPKTDGYRPWAQAEPAHQRERTVPFLPPGRGLCPLYRTHPNSLSVWAKQSVRTSTGHEITLQLYQGG